MVIVVTIITMMVTIIRMADMGINKSGRSESV